MSYTDRSAQRCIKSNIKTFSYVLSYDVVISQIYTTVVPFFPSISTIANVLFLYNS